MIQPITQGNLTNALALVNRVFEEFVAVDYSDEGNATFSSYLKTKETQWGKELTEGTKKMWGYYIEDTLAGVIATRDVSHISLMFVDKTFHKRGIARQLFDVVKKDIADNSDTEYISVNSSPYAVPVYERLGFVATDVQQEKDGIKYVPMKCRLVGE